MKTVRTVSTVQQRGRGREASPLFFTTNCTNWHELFHSFIIARKLQRYFRDNAFIFIGFVELIKHAIIHRQVYDAVFLDDFHFIIENNGFPDAVVVGGQEFVQSAMNRIILARLHLKRQDSEVRVIIDQEADTAIENALHYNRL